MKTALNQYISLGRSKIFITLSLQTYGQSMPLHLFRSLDSFSRSLQLSIYRAYICFRLHFLWSDYKWYCVFSLFFHVFISVYTNAIDFWCGALVYCKLAELTNSNSFALGFANFLAFFYIDSHAICKWEQFYNFLFDLNALYFFFLHCCSG